MAHVQAHSSHLNNGVKIVEHTGDSGRGGEGRGGRGGGGDHDKRAPMNALALSTREANDSQSCARCDGDSENCRGSVRWSSAKCMTRDAEIT